jgi:hypothetical protein
VAASEADQKQEKIMAEYNYVDVVVLGVNAANARVPRLQKSACSEFGEMLSREVATGEWVQDGEQVINSTGQTPEQYLDSLISTRPHWEIPATVVDAADDTWTSGSLTKQGKRWRELKSYLGSDAAADKALAEEAALYGVVPGTTKIGVKPGDVEKESGGKTGGPSPSNPWNDKTRFTPAEADAEKARLLKTLGTKACASLAAAAGKTVLGARK